MTNLIDNRVLSRSGARELRADEFEFVSAAFAHTNVCTAPNVVTLTGDADGCGGDVDHS
ncbi:MAG TPA: hypothetical protein VI685_17670 [Candidatus Angelobacter sp.]